MILNTFNHTFIAFSIKAPRLVVGSSRKPQNLFTSAAAIFKHNLSTEASGNGITAEPKKIVIDTEPVPAKSTIQPPVHPTEPGHIKTLVEQIAQLKFYEVAMLNEALKRELKIPDFAAVASLNAAAGSSGDNVEEEIKTKKTAFTVKLVKFEDSKKVTLIKEIKKIITGINLVEAKRFVEDCPKVIKANITKQEAEELQKQVEEAGGKVSVD